VHNPHVRYLCFPSVVCTGKETEIWIKPRDLSRVFRKDAGYSLAVVGQYEDSADYKTPIPLDHDFEIKDGCLVFRHTFDREQLYSIRFRQEAQSEIRLELYAVDADLYALRPLKGDLHSHSFCSDGVDGAAMTPADYREEGYDFFALTDHNRMYPSVFANALYDGIKLGMHILPGEEMHTPGSMVHLVHVGGKKSVCDQYIHDREGYEAAVDAIAETLPQIDPQYRRRVAMAKWACRQAHEAGGIVIFAHPCWIPNQYNLSPELLDLIYDNKMLDAFELMGGIPDRDTNLQLALWQEKALSGNYLPPVGSSDTHNHSRKEAGGFTHRFTVVFARENSTEAILDAIKSGYTLAADRTDDGIAHFYGSLRLVMFARFLYANYFNETWQICHGEGNLMRRYARGEDVGQTLSSLADSVENFYKEFYGITPPTGIPQARLDFQEALRNAHLNGPLTKGSHLFVYGKNTRND